MALEQAKNGKKKYVRWPKLQKKFYAEKRSR